MSQEQQLLPGTPEYDEAYQKEMDRLEAEAKGKSEPEAKAEAKPEEKPAEPKPEEPKQDQPTEREQALLKRVESTEKALRDTQQWGHKLAAQVRAVEQEREKDRHAATRPAILDQNPGLEDAIKHVSGGPKPNLPVPVDEGRERVITALQRAFPD